MTNLATVLQIIHAGLKPPQGCVLFYPSLNQDLFNSSPSCFLALDHPLLFVPVLELCTKAYVSEGTDSLIDPFISPVVASDELLEKMPPVRILVGSMEPFLDDDFRLVDKLR